MSESTIWGHTEVHIEKVPTLKKWIVSTVHNDPSKRQVLVQVPWVDAFKSFPYAPDYAVAVATCQASDEALTAEEEALVHGQTQPVSDAKADKDLRARGKGSVLSLADFRNRKKKQ